MNNYFNLDLSIFFMRRFENMEIYQKSYDLTLETYKILDLLPESESRNICSQLRRAITSIPLNISEGSGAHSTRDFFRYLTYSYKSSKEVKVLFFLIRDLNYISEDKVNLLIEKLDELTAKLYLFIKNIEKRCNFPKDHTYQSYKIRY